MPIFLLSRREVFSSEASKETASVAGKSEALFKQETTQKVFASLAPLHPSSRHSPYPVGTVFTLRLCQFIANAELSLNLVKEGSLLVLSPFLSLLKKQYFSLGSIQHGFPRSRVSYRILNPRNFPLSATCMCLWQRHRHHRHTRCRAESKPRLLCPVVTRKKLSPGALGEVI